MNPAFAPTLQNARRAFWASVRSRRAARLALREAGPVNAPLNFDASTPNGGQKA